MLVLNQGLEARVSMLYRRSSISMHVRWMIERAKRKVSVVEVEQDSCPSAGSLVKIETRIFFWPI